MQLMARKTNRQARKECKETEVQGEMQDSPSRQPSFAHAEFRLKPGEAEVVETAQDHDATENRTGKFCLRQSRHINTYA